jgi:putative ABC transport system permease protein
MSLWHRLTGRRDPEHDLDAEIRDHLDRQVADYIRSGLSEAEARRRAAASFGGVEQAKEYCRDVRRFRWIGDAWTDVRYGVRILAHHKVFTLVAVLSLALGIGANTAIFTLVNSLLLQSLPVRQPDRLVLLDKGSWTNPIWEQIRDRQHELFDSAAAWADESLDLARGGQAEPVNALLVSGGFFPVLGVPTILGRPIGPANDVRGGGQETMVVVLSYDFWQRHYSGDPEVLGRTLTLNRVPFTVVGVTSPRFRGPIIGRAFDVAVPLATVVQVMNDGNERSNRLDGRSTWWLQVIARLKAGQTIDGATSALRAVQPQIREATLPDGWPPQHLKDYLRDGLTFVPAAQGPGYLRRQFQQPLLIIMAVVGLVLLIACANIANLMMARANARRHELTMRLALGASGGRLTRQLLAESVLLALAGAALGLAFAQWGSGLLVTQLSTGPDTLTLDLSPDWRVLLFTMTVAVATALLFGTVPALRARTLAPIEALKEQGRGLAGTGRRFLANPLVVAQIALSLVLVVGAGLFMRTFAALADRNLGFDPAPVLLVNVDIGTSAVDKDQWGNLYERLREAAAAVPGVQSAAVSPLTPVSGMGWNNAFEFPDLPNLSERDRIAWINAITPDWLETYGVRLVSGRNFTSADRAGGPHVALVNQAFVNKFMKGKQPLGQPVQQAGRPGHVPPPMEVVGVVEDTAYRSVRDAAEPTVLVPMAQQADGEGYWPFGAISVKAATGSPAALTRSLAAALAKVDPNVSLRFHLLADQVSDGMIRERVLAMLSGFFGGLALVLAAVGLYGVTSYAVGLRRTEIGVRMALGADARRVMRLVLGRVALLIGLGVIIGAGLSLWLGRYVGELLFGLEPRDPATLAGASVVLVCVGALAAWIPARRAARIDPIEVLRES